VNKYPGNVLELAAVFEAATSAVNIITEQKAATDSLPSKVSVRSLVFGVAWMGVSLCQRFMLQEELGVLAVGVHGAVGTRQPPSLPGCARVCEQQSYHLLELALRQYKNSAGCLGLV